MVAPGRASLDLADYNIWIPGNQALIRTIHEQVQVFEHDRSDQGRLAFRFHDGGKDPMTAQDFHRYFADGIPTACPPVGITDLDLTRFSEPQLFGYRLG